MKTYKIPDNRIKMIRKLRGRGPHYRSAIYAVRCP